MRHFRTIALIALTLCLLIPSTVDGTAKKPFFHYRDKAIVLMYHHFSSTENGAAISPKKLRSQLKALKDGGYRFISMNDFMMFKLYGNDLPDNAVLITIDDGYASLYQEAYPIFREFGAEAAAFVVVQSTDAPMKNGENFPHLSWDQMREMKANGMSFYSHTYGLHHTVATDQKGAQKPALTGRVYDPKSKAAETDEAYRERVKADLERADRRLADELGNKTNLLCFPYGKYTDEAIEIGRHSRIRLFFTTKPGINASGDDILINRINAGSVEISDRALLKTLRTYDQAKR